MDDRVPAYGRLANSVSKRFTYGGPDGSVLANWCSGTRHEHDWLESRGELRYLVTMIDDATSRVFARFVRHDSDGREYGGAGAVSLPFRTPAGVLHR